MLVINPENPDTKTRPPVVSHVSWHLLSFPGTRSLPSPGNGSWSPVILRSISLWFDFKTPSLDDPLEAIINGSPVDIDEVSDSKVTDVKAEFQALREHHP